MCFFWHLWRYMGAAAPYPHKRGAFYSSRIYGSRRIILPFWAGVFFCPPQRGLFVPQQLGPIYGPMALLSVYIAVFWGPPNFAPRDFYPSLWCIPPPFRLGTKSPLFPLFLPPGTFFCPPYLALFSSTLGISVLFFLSFQKKRRLDIAERRGK